MAQLLIASECCPVGCGFEVVFLKSETDGAVFCFCDVCGCGWTDPADAHFSAGVAKIDSLAVFAPGGVGLATREDVERAGHSGSVIGFMDLEAWGDTLETLNSSLKPRR